MANHSLYRVYDHKGNYTQSYSSELKKGLQWATDCANRVNGRIDQIDNKDNIESVKTIFTIKEK